MKLKRKGEFNPKKADSEATYEFIPEGDWQDEKNPVTLVKKYFLAGQLTGIFGEMNLAVDEEKSSKSKAALFRRLFKDSVIRIKNLEDEEGKEITVDGLLNSYGSSIADTILVQSFADTMKMNTISEEEEKN